MDRESKNLFEIIAQGDDLTLQALLLEDKQDRNIATLAHGNTILHEASWKGFSRCVKILCNVYPKDLDSNKEKLGWKKNHFINRLNFSGFSALHLAAQNGHNQTIRELLYSGCQKSIRNVYGDSPMHTACRYGHAGVVRILISANCDIDSFNLNQDTPLHITCAMGRRKLTKLLLEAGAMQFQNLHHESPLDIAKRKKIPEIVNILLYHKGKIDKNMASRCSKSSDNCNHSHLLPHSSKQKYNNRQNLNALNWSPYGCHYYPDIRNFPSPKLESLPKKKLEKFEQYYLDLAGNIRKGPVGKGNKCFCAQFDKSAVGNECREVQKHLGKDNEVLNTNIRKLMIKIEKTVKKNQKFHLEKSSDINLKPMLKILSEKNKQLHLQNWLQEIDPVGNVKENSVDIHQNTKQSPDSSKQISMFDEKKNEDHLANQDDDDEENYTDISNTSEDESSNIASKNKNYLYDEGVLTLGNFQHQQFVQNTHQTHSLTSPSINSNQQNIETEMQKITSSLLEVDDGVMQSRNPDVIKDHVHYSVKRNMEIPTTEAAGNVFYANSFFNSNSHAYGKHDEVESVGSSTHIITESLTNDGDLENSDQPCDGWNQTGRSRNPLPQNIDEIERFTDSTFTSGPDTSLLDKNNFILLDQLMKARKKFNQSYQQRLKSMHHHPIGQAEGNYQKPSSSSIV